ncbi:hypothetical protein FK004_05625 [Flavobacterium kingsejongi]|uniref:Uncharacterized protein n=2 Tax=Flavobacterium kingsejongi TaxID=1678728 RepID=A0A2S1LLV8_9FLAO|nr:hypothetical protein FK004_05625 [Flavobacterium kingsejongi]
MLFSQEKKQDTLYLLLKLDKTVISSISKDSTRASFGVYKKGYPKKNPVNTNMPKRKDRQDIKNSKPLFVTKKSSLSISETLNFWSMYPPIKVHSLKNLNYITRYEFVSDLEKYLYRKHIFIIQPDNYGNYLIWKSSLMARE